MDNRGKRQASSLFGGMGFYIALLVCVVAAGVVGYFALLNNNDTQTEPTQTVDRTDPGPAQSVTAPAPEPSKPVISEEPVIVTRPAPQPAAPEPDPAPVSDDVAKPTMDTAPAAVQEPMEVASPLNGETVAVFSVDADGRLGTTIVVDHHNGYVTTYASLQPETAVLAGDTVALGDTLGSVGNTSLSEAGLGAHLHFSVVKDGQAVDPMEFLD